MSYLEVLEETAAATSANSTLETDGADGPDAESEAAKAAVALDTKGEVLEVAGEVADKKLNNLQGNLEQVDNAKVYDSKTFVAGTKLEKILLTGVVDGLGIETLLDGMDGMRTKVLNQYCDLGEAISKNMAVGVNMAFIDAVVGGDSDAPPNEGEKKNRLEVWSSALGKLTPTSLSSGDFANGKFMTTINTVLGAIGGSGLVLKRLKSVYYAMEITRKFKSIYGENIGTTMRSQSYVNNPAGFVDMVKKIEMMNLTPDVIAKITDKNGLQPFTGIWGLKDGTENTLTSEATTQAIQGMLNQLPLDVSSEVAEKLVLGMTMATQAGNSLMDNRKKNIVMAQSIKSMAKAAVDFFNELEGANPEEPSAIKEFIKKWVGPFYFLFTGEHLEIENIDNTVDPSVTDDGAPSAPLEAEKEPGSSPESVMVNGLSRLFPEGSIEAAAVVLICSEETGGVYNGVNPKDSGSISVGPLQRNRERADVVKDIIRENEEKAAEILGQEFVTLIKTDNTRYTQPTKWGQYVDKNGKTVYETYDDVDEDGSSMAEWKKNRYGNLKTLLDTDFAHRVMDEQIKKDISGYVTTIKGYLGLAEDETLTVSQKAAVVYLARVHNANPSWAKQTAEKFKGNPDVTAMNSYVHDTFKVKTSTYDISGTMTAAMNYAKELYKKVAGYKS